MWAGSIDSLEAIWSILDDTLIYVIIGDNGASAEGTLNGCFNEMARSTACPASRPPSS
jgi:arylsulfatase A-like enzyme